ncbi:TPA: tetracycline efflux MFS transporter Tet(D), partial [Klebsiella pneumoniae]|nr:tetracycline efflux MFS transporter Tet(D) [Klebsiella pneumoniae]
MNKPAVIALVITLLDAMGIGLIMPVLPSLLREYLPEADVANHYGILLALYAVMQVCFAPLLGRWSDKLGRRPVLLLSLAGAAFDYTLLALSNVLWMLYLGRIISGITGATGAVAASVVADSTAVSERTAWFGRLGAAFGAGLIAGPAIGGLAGDISPHLPFVIAAILNACTFLMVFFIFKPAVQTEEKPAEQKQESAGISFITLLKPLALLLFVFFTAQLIGQIPATVWVLFTESRFAWDSAAVGFSLAGLGAMHALFQAVVAGALAKRLSEKTIIFAGFIADATAFLLMSAITSGWMVYPVLILLAGGGIALPALQGIISAGASAANQGKLQGVLVSLTNLTGVAGPPLFAFIFSQTQQRAD